jgi:hypothetical protein
MWYKDSAILEFKFNHGIKGYWCGCCRQTMIYLKGVAWKMESTWSSNPNSTRSLIHYSFCMKTWSYTWGFMKEMSVYRFRLPWPTICPKNHTFHKSVMSTYGLRFPRSNWVKLFSLQRMPEWNTHPIDSGHYHLACTHFSLVLMVTSVTKVRTQKLSKKFKIVTTCWHDHSLEGLEGHFLMAPLVFRFNHFWVNISKTILFPNFSQKTCP